MKAGVIGATGYAGAELVRLLLGHSNIDDLILSSVSFEGGRIEEVYPNFIGRISSSLVKAETVVGEADVVFSALPHGVGEQFAKICVEKGKPFIDLSADFRFGGDEAAFKKWYGKDYIYPELRKYSIYGLPELNRRRIREQGTGNREQSSGGGAVIIGNPGCYPTGASLGCFPALAKGIAAGTIIVNAASGTSGGGREPSRQFHYSECADSIAPYKIGSHRHTPEIVNNFAAMAATESRVSPPVVFTPHLVPMNRGILSTIYIPLTAEYAPAENNEQQVSKFRSLYADFYKDEPFVRVLPPGVTAATNRVRNSNYCDISVHLDHSGSILIVVSAIDNMVKGAAGQAIQNMNLILGFNEKTALESIPALF
jgi:N-acetyl-gamma-glutamyl-phosphate reductase